MIFGLLAIIGCQQSKKIPFSLEAEKVQSEFDFTVDTLVFEIDQGNGGYKNPNSGTTNDGRYFCYLNNKSEFYFFDLIDKKSFTKKIKTTFINPNEVKGTCFHSLDTIFVFYQNYLLILDTSGLINLQIDIFNINPVLKNYVLEFDRLADIRPYFNTQTQTLFFGIHSKKNYKWTITHSFEADLNLKTHKIEFCDIIYPERFKFDSYGWLENPKRASNNGLHIYSFAAEPNLYSYNVETKEKKMYGGKSNYQSEDSKYITKGTKLKDIIRSNSFENNYANLIESSYYGSFIFDRYSKKYFRLFYLPLPKKMDSIRYNTLKEKKAKLMIFNQKLELENEIDFELDNFIDFFPSKVGLILRIPNKSLDFKNKTSSKVYFKVFKFK
jgi:hypothetical protein